MPRSRLLSSCIALGLCACAHSPRVPVYEPGTSITLVESAPLETTLDHGDVPNASDVWLEMIGAATRTLDISEFYASDSPGSRLSPIIAAVRAAAGRGVHVRFILDDSFAEKYPETLSQLTGVQGLELRRLVVQKLMGGVQHAKYFVVDGRDAYLGSQNFDWRSLEHIQEIGVRLRSPMMSRALLDVFELDWSLAGGAKGELLRRAAPGPVRLESGETVSFIASPRGWLPDEDSWELPELVRLLDGAQREIAVQVLVFKIVSRDGSLFPDLDQALRRAVARGVKVRLLVSDWANKRGSAGRRDLSELARAGVEVRVITIPPWSGGAVPFARVCHAKYLVVDGARSWVSTSNWEGDYFLKSRNVGVIVDSAPFTVRLARVLDDGWNSTYSKPLVPMENGEQPDPPRH